MEAVPVDNAVAPLTTPQQVKRSLAGNLNLSGGHAGDLNSHLTVNQDVTDADQQEGGNTNTNTNKSQKIQAYAMLDFDSFTFYVQTMQIILGRMVDGDGGSDSLDIHLGSQKAISRRHAKIFYNFGNQRFELSVLGRNGAFVDEAFVEKGVTVPLHNGSKVQIGETGFVFELPNKGGVSNENSKKGIENGPPSVSIKKQKKRLPSITEADILAIAGVDGVRATNKDIDIEKEIEKVLADHNMEVEDKDSKFDKDLANALRENSASNKYTQSQSQPQSQSQSQSDDKKSKQKKNVKPKKKVYELEEIPPQYREKPALSYSTLITECLRQRSTPRGMSLSEIYKAIQDLYPYYFYAPDGWQSSVRHNLSLNKSFRKISKEGKGWLWGLNEEVIAEKERQKEKQLENAKAKVKNIQAQQIAKANQKIVSKPEGPVVSQLSRPLTTTTTSNKPPLPTSTGTTTTSSTTATTTNTTTVNDNTKRALAYLQKELIQLTKNRYSMYDKETTTEILTQALAMTINQVGQAAKSAGIKGSPLVTLIDKNPQHITKILTAALNAATLQVTRKRGLPNYSQPKKEISSTNTTPHPIAPKPTVIKNEPIKSKPPISLMPSASGPPTSQPSLGMVNKKVTHPIRLQHPIKVTQSPITPLTSTNKPMIHTFTKPMQFSKPSISTIPAPMKMKPLKPSIEANIANKGTTNTITTNTANNTSTDLNASATNLGSTVINSSSSSTTTQVNTPVSLNTNNSGVSKPQFYSKNRPIPSTNKSIDVNKPFANVNISNNGDDLDLMIANLKKEDDSNNTNTNNTNTNNVNTINQNDNVEGVGGTNIGTSKKADDPESFAQMLDSFISDNHNVLNGVLNDKKRPHDDDDSDALDKDTEPNTKIVKTE